MSQFLARRWRRQPQGATLIDWSNPITRGLSTVFLPSLRSPAIDLVTGVFDTATTKGSLLPRNSAIAYSVTGTSVAWSLNFAPVGIPSGYAAQSIFTLFEQYDTTTFGPIFGAGLNSSLYMRFEKNADGSVTFVPNTNTGATATLIYPVLNTNQVYALAGVQQGNFREAFIDGASIGSSNTSITFLNSGYGYAGSAFVSSRFRRVGIYCGYGWTRRLTPFEILSLTDNPWQLFAPQKTISYSLPADLYTAIDEVISDRTDYIESSTAGQVYQTTLQPVAQPGANTNIDFNFEADSPDDASSLKFDLLSGQTVVKSQTVSLVRNWAGRLRLPQLRQQPQGAVQIDWSNPLARNLEAVILPTSNQLIARPGAWSTSSTPPSVVTRLPGRSLQLTGSTGYWNAPAGSWVNAGTDWTMLAVATLRVASTDNSIVTIANSPGNSVTDRAIYVTNSNVVGAYVFDGSGRTISGTTTVSAGQPFVIAGKAAVEGGANRFAVFLNGKLEGSLVPSGIGYTGYSTPTLIAGYGTSSNPGAGSSVDLSLAFVFSRGLSDAEIKALSDNPWQIFRPPQAHAVSYVRPLDTTIAVTPSDYSAVTSWPWTPTLKVTSL